MGGTLHASKLLPSFNLTSSLGIPTESIITSPDKAGMFPSFSDMKFFLASSVTSPYSGTFYLTSSADGLDTCGKKVGDDEEEGMIWGAGTEVFNLTSSSVLPTESIITYPDKAGVFPSFSNRATFLASSVPYPSPDTFSLASSAAGFDTCIKKGGDDE